LCVLFIIELLLPSTLRLFIFYRFQAVHTSWLGVPSTNATRGLLHIMLLVDSLLEVLNSTRGDGNFVMLDFY